MLETFFIDKEVLLVAGVEQALGQMKYEIATEFGVQLGADTTSRANGSVGGEITKRLVAMAESQLGGSGGRIVAMSFCEPRSCIGRLSS